MDTEYLHELAAAAALTLHGEDPQRLALTDPYGNQVTPDSGLGVAQVEALLVERVAPIGVLMPA